MFQLDISGKKDKEEQEEYNGAVEEYKNILQMIDELKKNKELYLKRQEESAIENEKEKQRQYEEMLNMQEKKKKFGRKRKTRTY